MILKYFYKFSVSVSDWYDTQLLETASIFLEYKFSLSYSPGPLFHIIFSIFLFLNIKNVKKGINNDNFINLKVSKEKIMKVVFVFLFKIFKIAVLYF